jgi:5'-phosphate synthase pdxT subunit
MIAGVLGLQGSSALHEERLRELGARVREVRQLRDLHEVQHLILPGGESTTIHHLLELYGLRTEIVRRFRSGTLALFGTCAGAILLGQDDGERPPRLGLLDAVLTRNAYGRQIDSFTRDLTLTGIEGGPFHGVFIRAPRFRRWGTDCRILAVDGDDPVLLEAPGILAATFHPELTQDLRVHQYFLAMQPFAGTVVQQG